MAKAKKGIEKSSSSSMDNISKLFVVLYLFVAFTPLFGGVDYDASEWLYVSVLNIASLVLIYKNRDTFKASLFPKHLKYYLLIYLGFFAISCLSVITAINVSEAIIQLGRLIAVTISFYCLVIFIRHKPSELFEFVLKVVTLIVIYFSFKAFVYFLGNASSARTDLFVFQFPHNLASVNIYTAYLIVQIPFVIYSFLVFKKLWKYIAAVALFMVFVALLFSGSRTAMLSLSVIFILTTIFCFYSLKKFKITFYKEYAFLLLGFIVASFLVLNVNRVNKSEMNSFTDIFHPRIIDDYKGTKFLLDNKADIASLKPNFELQKPQQELLGRFSLWKLAFDNFKTNPLLGVGYGNFKAVDKSEFYQKNPSTIGTFKSPRRAHNDFIEKLAETGVFGFICYSLLFIFPLILFIKTLKTEKEFTHQFTLIVIFLSAMAYTFDALLNFPLERAPVHMYFLLATAFILSFYKGKFSGVEKNKKHYYLFIPLFVIGLISVILNFKSLKSYQLQKKMRDDLSGKTLFTDQKLKYSYNDIMDKWIEYPQLSYTGTSNNVYKANYAVKAKKYDDARQILDKSMNYTGDGFLVKAFKAELLLSAYKDVDSAKYYSEIVFEGYPIFKTNYRLLKTIYKNEEDSVNLFRVVNRFTKLNKVDAGEWVAKANLIYSYTNDSDAMLKVIDTGLVYNPTSYKLLSAKKKVLDNLKFKSFLSDKQIKAKHQTAYNFFSTQRYNEAKNVYNEILKTNPKDYLSIQNIGIIQLIQKDFKASINNLTKVIDANSFTDGKAEYSRAYCYEQLKEMQKAKEDYKASRAKNYPQAMSLPKSKYE